MKKEYEEIERKFAGMPRLQELFKEYARKIKNYDDYEWSEDMTKEKLIKKRDTLMEIAEKLSYKDLLVYYYINKVRRFGYASLIDSLKGVYKAEWKTLELLEGREEFEDIMEIKDELFCRMRKKGKKS